MNKPDQENLKMTYTTLEHIAANLSVLSTIPGFSPMYQTAQTSASSIQNLVAPQITDSSGKAMSKAAVRKLLSDLAVDLADKVHLYAINTNNLTLSKQVDVSDSSLNKLSDINFVGKCQTIYDAANTNLKALATYLVTAASQTTFLNYLNSYKPLIAQARGTQKVDINVKNQIKTLFETLRTTWANIDVAMRFVRLTQPLVYTDYLTARKIIKLSSSKHAGMLSVTDSQTNEVVANAVVVLAPAESLLKTKAVFPKKILNKKTTKKGRAIYKSLPEGEYTITVQKAGYKSSSATINIIAGETLKLDIKLEKA